MNFFTVVFLLFVIALIALFVWGYNLGKKRTQEMSEVASKLNFDFYASDRKASGDLRSVVSSIKVFFHPSRVSFDLVQNIIIGNKKLGRDSEEDIYLKAAVFDCTKSVRSTDGKRKKYYFTIATVNCINDFLDSTTIPKKLSRRDLLAFYETGRSFYGEGKPTIFLKPAGESLASHSNFYAEFSNKYITSLPGKELAKIFRPETADSLFGFFLEKDAALIVRDMGIAYFYPWKRVSPENVEDFLEEALSLYKAIPGLDD